MLCEVWNVESYWVESDRRGLSGGRDPAGFWWAVEEMRVRISSVL